MTSVRFTGNDEAAQWAESLPSEEKDQLVWILIHNMYQQRDESIGSANFTINCSNTEHWHPSVLEQFRTKFPRHDSIVLNGMFGGCDCTA